MGTRNLMVVVINGEYKIAQYGQSDGYPSGQGVTALDFLRSKKRQEQLKKKLTNCVFLTDAEVEKGLREIGIKSGWMTSEDVIKFHQKFPYLTRDNGAEILALVAESTDTPIQLQNHIGFAGDSLFCEWAYVVDFDKNTFEVYKGFNKEPLNSEERFAGSLPERKSEYTPIRLVETYSLNRLPTKQRFIKTLEPKEK